MSSTAAADPVTQALLVAAFGQISEEMAVVEYRSSYSPIIREMLDFNCGLFTADARMVANSEQIPAQLGLMQFALEAVLEKWTATEIEPGDAFLTNHPYMGGTHTPDLQVFTPWFRDGAIAGWTGSIAHHIDIGGRFPGSESAQCTELFQEGLIFPAIKLVGRGQRARALYELIAANVRDPAATLGDLDAQLAACRRGSLRLDELADRYGTATIGAGMRALLERTAERAEAAFSQWPDRTVAAEGFLDDEGFEGTSPVRVHAELHVDDGNLIVDLSGSSAQIPSGMNVPLSSSHAATFFAVRAFLGPDVPQNAGLTSKIRVIAPTGSLFNPRFPAALSARHLGVQRLTDVLVEALGDLMPDRGVAASHVSFPAIVFQAVDPRTGHLTLLADILGGGGGARREADGDDGIDPYCSNCAILPTEIAELEYPWRIERTELVDGSAGAGRWRGGLGLRRDYRLLADVADGMYYVEQTREAFAPRGRAGGGPGAPGSAGVRRAGSDTIEPFPGKGHIELHRDDVLVLVGAGGGGYGAAVRVRDVGERAQTRSEETP